MRKLLLTIAAVAFAASVIPSAPAATGVPTPDYVEGISFGEPVRMQYEDPTQIGGPGEPSLKVDSAGTVYTAGVCCVVRAAPAWYSQDGGKSFSYLSSPGGARENGIGAEGDFIVDDADGIYFSDTWVPSILVTRWSGHGDVFEYTRDTTIGVIPGLDDRPWLAYTHGDLYLYVNHGTHVAVYKSEDGAQTWTESFSTLGRGQRYWTGHVAADRRTGSVYLFGANCELGQMCAASSHDGGETWTEVAAGTLPRGARANFMVAAAVDAAGNVYGTFTDINSSGCDTYLAVSSDRGATWRQFRVNPEGGCATFPWVAAGDDGRVALSWYHNPEERHQDQVPPTSEWRLQAAVVTDATSDSPTVTYGTMDRVIHRGPLGRELWDFQQIDVGPDGRFHIAAGEDHEPPCAGTLSVQGSLAAYQNMCTTYVGQAGGPRASLHATDATSVGDVTAAAADGGVSVSGTVSFGRAAPAKVIDDEIGDAQPSLDLGAGRIVRRNATAEDLVLELEVDALPEALWGAGVFAWHLRVGEEPYRLVMQPRPRSFELCKGDECTPVRGDTDAGGDRVVAHVPLSLLGAGSGDVIGSVGADSFGVVGSPDAQTIDHADGAADYVVPGATVTVRGLDAAGNPVEQQATLSNDLSSFSAFLAGAVPGSVEVEACFGERCVTGSSGVG